MKICMATDFHLSYRQYGVEDREDDFYTQYHKMISEVIRESPKMLIILGDIFDTPYPKPIAIQHFKEGLKLLKQNGIECYGIVGNHTLVQRNNFLPIDNVFDDMMTVIDNDYMIVDGVFIGGVRYHSRTHGIREIVDELYTRSEGCKLKILLLHQILRADQEIGYDFDEEELELDRFDYVFLGHLHKRLLRYGVSSDTVFHYVGSLNSCSIVELKDEMENGKGYTVFDTDSYMLEMKTVSRCRDYLQYSLTDDELNDGFIDDLSVSLKQYSIKPIVQLDLFVNDTSNIYDELNKLKNDCLVLKHKVIKPVVREGNREIVDFGKFSVERLVRERFEEEWEADFCLDLLDLLGNGKVAEAKELANLVYEKRFQNQTHKTKHL